MEGEQQAVYEKYPTHKEINGVSPSTTFLIPSYS